MHATLDVRQMVIIELSDVDTVYPDDIVYLFGLLDDLCESYCQISVDRSAKRRTTDVVIPMRDIIDIDRLELQNVFRQCNKCIRDRTPLIFDSEEAAEIYRTLEGRIPDRSTDILEYHAAQEYMAHHREAMSDDVSSCDEKLKEAQEIVAAGIPNAMEEILSYPNVKLMWYAREVLHIQFTQFDLEFIARLDNDKGAMEKFHYMRANGIQFTENICARLIDDCIYNPAVVRAVLYAHAPSDCRFSIWAAKRNDLDLLHHLRNCGAEWDARVCLAAIENNNLGMLMYLREYRDPMTGEAMPCPWNNIRRDNSAHLQTTRIPLAKKYKATDYGPRAAKAQLRSSRFDTYSKAELQNIRQPPDYICLCTVAASKGLLGILMYMRTDHPSVAAPWDEYTCIEAVRSDRATCLQYAIENGCPYDISILIQLATMYASDNCMHYLQGLLQ